MAASNVGQLLEDGMDSSSEKNDVVRHDVSRRIPVVCWNARPFAASKSFPSPSVQSRLPDDVVHAVHQRRARCKHRQEDDIIWTKHAAEVNVQMNKNLRSKSFSGRPLSRHVPSLRRLERNVVLQNFA